ncbi:helix-turn-helix transcriptional regulator [Paenibacillus sp. GYB003]|uniref:helix-turn-helix transcriptional regulator n=1 Tax=Paenibacillus sp. GYB003 TaxID=2994392 RepID=UPI002F966E3D
MTSGYRPIQTPKMQQEQQRPGYRYREYAPCESLASHVACYWTVDFHADVGNQLHRIIPDGCVDIILDRRSPSGRKAAFVAGLMTRFEVLNFSEARSLFGIRFYSESAQSVLRFPVSDFFGQHVFLEDVWGASGRFMAEEMLSVDTVSGIIEIVERNLNHMLRSDGAPTNSLIYASLQYMYAFKGSLSASELADKLGFSKRHLRRTFDRELGVSPKEMLGIVRFQSVLQELYGGARSSFTDIAAKYGYYDQSHFIKNFKRYYGILPGQLSKTD